MRRMMVWVTVCGGLALGILGHGGHARAGFPVSPPLRPLDDVSIKTPATSFYQWYQGHIATQPERDAMEESLDNVLALQALAYARTLPGCKSAYAFGVTLVSVDLQRLGPEYEEDISLKIGGTGKGSWAIDQLAGRHYSFGHYLLQNIRSCSTSVAAKGCAASLLLTSRLQHVLDLHVENGRCAEGSDAIAYCDGLDSNGDPCTPPLEDFDKRVALDGVVQSFTPMPAPRGPDLALLQAAEDAHHANALWLCGLGPKPPDGATARAHMAYESGPGVTTNAIHHFRRMKDFPTWVDSRWTKDEVSQWAAIEEFFHMRWGMAERAGDWAHAREADNDHQLAHDCAALQDEALQVRFSCDTPDGDDIPVRRCPVQSCREALAMFAAIVPPVAP